MQTRRVFLESIIAAGAFGTTGSAAAQARETIRIGFSVPMTGSFAPNGRQMVAATKLFLEQHGTNLAGRKIELIIRDDGGVPAKRIAQELVVNSKVAILAGYNNTPVALAVAPISAEAKIPQIVMAAGTSIITDRSPYIARTFTTRAQLCVPMARWAAKNGIRKVVTIVSDFAPGYDSEKSFSDEFKAKGGVILEALRVPLQSPDFAPYLQRARDASPNAIFLWFPGPIAGTFARQYVERGLHTSGIKLIGTGDVTDDAVNQMGDPMLGMITAFNIPRRTARKRTRRLSKTSND
jgi:branched-chain amino acid transport system substrate-binding protein